ncbi:DUF1775 domain-containing protein [Chelatococcus asaccharovorans]|nr:DUF1775 domain-containing protein [Chelatococcus asaccharovorans]
MAWATSDFPDPLAPSSVSGRPCDSVNETSRTIAVVSAKTLRPDKATNTVRVRIPDGVIAVKPQPKPGWKLEKVKGKYAKSYDYYGTPTSEGVTEVVWSGGNLADDEYDEFVLRGYLTGDLKADTTLYFPVVQECPDGAAARWIEIPEEGKKADDYEKPAPGLKLVPKK